ncbi:MAG: acyl-CoA dehydrogenase family protein [Desulfatiglans sp.]|jgi:alkylation response protein AidB-like acyl-CoA dehydrogenase|nr:acyl-CoA dehydrogenase family protein [Thermodesulfobacteriota bacterium]MEE4352142.1 acyl-CoA dehydrogenase family protein [Desulfatiglans sp.]
MDFELTDEQKQFRQEVRSFLQAEMEAGTINTRSNNFFEHNKSFSKKMSEKGWVGMTWPKEFGGQGRSYLDRIILVEECLRVQAPLGAHFLGDRQVGPAIIHAGTKEQQDKYLPLILNADISFCLLFSEPEAGSDLVSARTLAERDGDDYILNGQKVWNSGAHLSDYGWCLAKTDPKAAKKHLGLSEFIIDMKSPGVDVRPTLNLLGEHHFNEVFLDNVRVPKDYLVGEVNRGFVQLMQQMDYERAGLERLMQNFPLYGKLIQFVKDNRRNGIPLSKDPMVRDQIAQLEIDFNAGRLLCYQVAWLLDQGRIPSREAALCKAYCTQFKQRLAETATRIMGPYGVLMPGSPYAPFDGEAPENYLYSRSYTLQGGTVEVLKGIVARRGLQLPTLR